MCDKSDEFRVDEELVDRALTKAVKPEFRTIRAGIWPVYKKYEVVEEGGEPFVIAPISRYSFVEPEPYKTEIDTSSDKAYLVQRFAGRSPLQDAMTFYAPLKTPELVLDLAELAEKKITPEAVRRWAETYGLLGFPDEDVVRTEEELGRYKVSRSGRRDNVRRFTETAQTVRACLRTYEAITADSEVELDSLLSTAGYLPRKAFLPFGPVEQHIGKERSWLFRVIGRTVQLRLEERCYPLFGARTRNDEATGKFALTWGFRGLVGAIWLHMAWLLEAENERVKRCKLPDCLRVIHFEPGEPAEDPGLKRNVRGKYKTRKDRIFCKGRACKQNYHNRKKAGWAGYD